MSVVGNTFNSIGDEIQFKSQCAVIGDVDINSFIDQLIGETQDRYFEKIFKYSLDGNNFSSWMTLNDENLQKVNGRVNSLLHFEFIYTRKGTDSTGQLVFSGLSLLGNILIQLDNLFTTKEGLIRTLTENSELTAALSNNLLRKIYGAGIVPEYIERGEGIEDDDFISFWFSICYFLASFVSLANKFERMFTKNDHLKTYLIQKDLKLSSHSSFADLQHLSMGYFDEIRKRGTIQIIKKKGDLLKDSSIVPIDGELLRFINFDWHDEFLFSLIRKEHNGFFLNKSSILYNGNYGDSQLNKTEENTKDFVDLDKYVKINENKLSIVQDGDLNVLKIEAQANVQTGVGFDTPPIITSLTNLIKVDKEIDYEISFLIKRSSDLTNSILEFGVHGYNRDGVLKPIAFHTVYNGKVENKFLYDENNSLTKISDVWYKVRGIIYGSETGRIKFHNGWVSDKYSRSNIIGENLIFNNNENIENVKPYIKLTSDDSNGFMSIHDFKMNPLIRGKNILPNRNTGKTSVSNPQFIQSNGFIICWLRNNNEAFNNLKLRSEIENKLLPYRNKLQTYNLAQKKLVTPGKGQILNDLEPNVINNDFGSL